MDRMAAAAAEAADLQRPAKHIWKWFTEDDTNEAMKSFTVVLEEQQEQVIYNHIKMKHPLPAPGTSSKVSTNEQQAASS